MDYKLTNPSGRLVSASDEALIQIVTRGEFAQFKLHTPVDPHLFLNRIPREGIKDTVAYLQQAAASCTKVFPLPGAEAQTDAAPEVEDEPIEADDDGDDVTEVAAPRPRRRK